VVNVKLLPSAVQAGTYPHYRNDTGHRLVGSYDVPICDADIVTDRTVHCKKKVNDFPVPSRDVTNQTLPARQSLVSDIPAGDRNIANLFYSVFCFIQEISRRGDRKGFFPSSSSTPSSGFFL
jgi:hypothetical protein